MEKPIAGFLQVTAAFLFIASGAIGEEGIVLIVPAVIAQISGLLLWGKAQRMGQLPPPPRAADEGDRRIAQVQEVLSALQDDVAKLREDREFFQRLYARTPHEP